MAFTNTRAPGVVHRDSYNFIIRIGTKFIVSFPEYQLIWDMYNMTDNVICHIKGDLIVTSMRKKTPGLFNKIIHISKKIRRLLKSGVSIYVIADNSRYLTPGNESLFVEYFNQVKIFNEIVTGPELNDE